MLSDVPFQLPENSDVQRLFHGRGQLYEGFEHICIDWLSPVVLITLYKEVDETELRLLASKLASVIPEVRSVQVQYRYLQQGPIELLIGEDCTQTEVVENSLKYQITLGRAQNTGLFLDMKNGRQWVQQHAQDKRVLNLFSYTCGFSTAAIAGGAESVFNIDMSRVSLTQGRENHRLNQHDTSKVKFDAIDIFKSFGRIKKHGPYDLLICDPPSFQKGSVDIERDYKKIIKRLPDFMSSDGLVMLCLNSPDLGTDFLKQTVADECPSCHLVEELHPPEVFRNVEVDRGLKVLVYQYK